jgi:hypothetical protein
MLASFGPHALIWLRNRQLRAMFKRKDPALSHSIEAIDPAAVPKIIWIYWHSGEADAPEIVARCIASWRSLNPGWDVRVLDDASYARFADMSDVKTKRIAHWADILRLRLLARHGGVWADATLLCARPLDHWLPLVTPSGFFAFSRPGPDRIIANWIIASVPGNTLTVRLEKALTRYWIGRRRVSAYFAFHYLTEHLVRSDPAAAQIWARTPKVPAEPMLALHEALKTASRPNFAPTRFDCAPVHKLSWKGGPSWPEIAAALGLEPEAA